MKNTFFIAMAMGGLLFFSCKENKEEKDTAPVETEVSADFDYNVEQFGDVKVLRYQISGWEKLTPKEQKLVYYLTQAGLEGRDIMWDQNYRYNLTIRKALENVYTNYKGDKTTEDWKNFKTYLKRVWFSSGIHHHHCDAKLEPAFSPDYLRPLLPAATTTSQGEARDVIFNGNDSKTGNQAKGVEHVLESAVNSSAPDVTNQDVEAF